MSWTSVLKNGTPVQIAKYLRNNAIDIGIACGFEDLRNYPHGLWLHDIIDGVEDETIQAHRGAYKTTCISIALAVWIVTEPNSSTMLTRKTDGDVVETIKQARKILTSEYMQSIIWHMYGRNIGFIKDTENEIDTDLKSSIKGTSQLLGIGIGSSLQGKHFDRIVTDDIVTIRDRVSQAERKKTRLYYEELHNIKNRDGRMINCCTPWHKDDATTKMPNVKKFTWSDTGLITKEQAQKLREENSPSMFAANYELKHIADANALFSKEPTFDTDITKLYNGVAHIDASYGGEDGTAFTCGQRKGDALYMYGRLWQKHVDQCLPEILEICKAYRCQPIYCEDNADKGYLRKAIMERGTLAKGYHEDMNKYYKISTYLRKWWGKIVWIEGTDPEYINQILDYTEDAAHDDSADSAASIIVRKLDKASFNIV